MSERLAMPEWSRYAWGAIALAAGFIGLTCWWLSQDRSIPIYDAGDHLWLALHYHELIGSGDLLGPFNHTSQYPPLGHLVGAFAAFVGGVNVSAPIVGENVVFVSLLTLGCYQTGKLLFGPAAGLLAAIFALGSPLLIAQFHVFMLEAPETALVAVSMWLLLASDRFRDVRMSALAGVAVAAGLMVKVQFPFFVLGIALCALIRGGWRNWRGWLACGGLAVALGSPWYVDHLSELREISRLAGAASGATPEQLPPTFSLHNLTWYLWTILDSQLLLPLFMLLAIGVAWTAVALVRRSGEAFGARLDFFVGGVVAWLAVTLTPHHDLRYGLPLLAYLAVIATGWIVRVPRAVRPAAIATLAVGVALNTLGTTFGVGSNMEVAVGRSLASTYVLPPTVTLYSSSGFLVAGPKRDGDVPGLLRELRRNGVRTVDWGVEESSAPDFSFEGLIPLSLIAKLSELTTARPVFSSSSEVATLLHRALTPSDPAPCVTLSDGTGVFVVRWSPVSGQRMYYCPSRNPSYY